VVAARFDVTFGAVSQHLRVLEDAGLISVRRDGRRRLYQARREQLGPLRAVLEAEPGGRLRVGYPTGQVAGGRVVALEADRRIVFTWGYEGDGQAVPAGSSTVEITLEPQAGGTRVAPAPCRPARRRAAHGPPGRLAARPGHPGLPRRRRPAGPGIGRAGRRLADRLERARAGPAGGAAGALPVRRGAVPGRPGVLPRRRPLPLGGHRPGRGRPGHRHRRGRGRPGRAVPLGDRVLGPPRIAPSRHSVPDQAEASSRATRSILTRKNTTNPPNPRRILHTGSERAKLCGHGGARSVRLPEARTTPGRADRP
jgi:uncharacterized protein YndB with AHSA1/START domain